LRFQTGSNIRFAKRNARTFWTVEVRAERLLDHDADIGLLVAVEAGLLELLGDHGEELGRRREVVHAGQRLPGLLVELLDDLAERAVGLVVVEGHGDVAHALEQPVEHLRVGLAARVGLDRLLHDLAELVVGLLAARGADQVEALGQRPLVREVVERGQQLALGEVARRAEDDHRRRRDRKALEALDEGVLTDLPVGRIGGDRGRH
jgi:hypothetical protein